MNITESGGISNCDYTGYFQGKPCEVLEGFGIVLPFGEMTTEEMINSKIFQMLEKAGFDVHRDWRDAFLERGRH